MSRECGLELPTHTPIPMRLILTHGLPGSGKTTWAIPYAQKHDILRVNRDELRSQIAGKRYAAGDQDPRTEGRVSSAIFSAVKAELAAGRDVLVDDTNMNTRSVMKWARIAQDYGATLEHVYFDITLDEALANNDRRSLAVPEQVIRRMADGAFSHDGQRLLRYAVSPATEASPTSATPQPLKSRLSLHTTRACLHSVGMLSSSTWTGR